MVAWVFLRQYCTTTGFCHSKCGAVHFFIKISDNHFAVKKYLMAKRLQNFIFLEKGDIFNESHLCGN